MLDLETQSSVLFPVKSTTTHCKMRETVIQGSMEKKSLNIQLYTRNSFSQLGLGSPNTREMNPGICAEETNGQYPEKTGARQQHSEPVSLTV